jgi:hypothetical protein
MVENARRGTEVAGRKAADVELPCYVPCGVSQWECTDQLHQVLASDRLRHHPFTYAGTSGKHRTSGFRVYKLLFYSLK